jgi:Big-like domain-containing protein/beta-propeller repeat-containing protein
VRLRWWTAVFILLLAIPGSSYGQSGEPLALSERPGGGSFEAVVSDGSGGVWVAGTNINGAVSPPADALQPQPAGSEDGVIMHIGPDGSVLYSTYLGGTLTDHINAIARDAAGNIYVAGGTNSTDFPTTAGAFRYAAQGGGDAFVAKLDPTGKHLLYSTYLGGAEGDQAYGIAVDAGGSAHVVGTTQGWGFPYTWDRCLDSSVNWPPHSSFYTRFSADGTKVLFSTCFDDSTARGVTLDSNGDAYVVGSAGQHFSPRMGSNIGTFPQNASSEGFFAKFTLGATNPLPVSMYIGGDVTDWANGVAVSTKGVYVAGAGYSANYPGATRQPHPQTATLEDGTTVTVADGTAWIMKVSLDGTQILGTTLIDGIGSDDEALALQVDASEVVHVTGWTDSSNFPVSADAPQGSFGGRVDAWYAKAWMPNNVVGDPSYLTYLGGSDIDRGRALVLDGTGGAWVAGETSSSNFPATNAKASSTGQAFVARFGQPLTSTTAGAGDVVLYARDAAPIVGNWQLVADTTAAAGTRIWNPDAGMAKITTPAAAPANYFELAFNADAGVPYHLWLRLRADNDSYTNDSVWVQFSDSVDSSGNPIWRSGTTSGTWVSLEDCSGCGEQGWGWNDNGYGTAATPVYFAASGAHTIRIQQREDGVSIDQVILSSATWANTAPGANKNDTTIVPQTATAPPPPPPPPPPSNQPPTVSITSPTNGTTFSQSSWPPITASASDADGTIAKVDFYVNSTLVWTSTTSPYHFTWETEPAPGTYSLTAVATDNGGASTTSSPVTITITASGSGGLPPFFADADIGDVGAAGSATYSNGTYTVQGSGADVWGTADAFNYVSESLSGDGAIVARVATVSGEANWVKAGVMLRASPSAGAAQAFMLVSHAKGVCFQRRVSDGNTTVSTCDSTLTAPRWVKLVRAGNVISAYQSADGAAWTLVGSDTFTMLNGIYAGLAVSSHIWGTLSTATFDNVSVIDAVGPNRAPTVSITSPSNGATFTAPATVTITANATDDTSIAKVDFYANSTLIGTVAGNYEVSDYSFTWSNVPAGTYTLTAIATDDQGATTTSAPVSITVGDAPQSQQCSSLTLSQTYFYSGGPSSTWQITVTAPSTTCTWTASIDQSWLVLNDLTGPAMISGTGSGQVKLQTLDNQTGAYRYGTFTIGGVAYKVTQEPF